MFEKIKKFTLFVVVGSAMLALVSFFLMSVYFNSQPRELATILIQNHTNEVVVSAAVSAFGTEHVVGEIEAGGEFQIVFQINGEGGYRVSAVFASGRKLQSKEMGYLTVGLPSKDVIVIQKDEFVYGGVL